MSLEQLSTNVPAEAKNFYEEHRLLAGAVATAGQRRSEAGTRLTQATRDLAEARFRHQEATDRYLYGRGSFNRVESLGDGRDAALDRHTRAVSDYHDAGPQEDQAKRGYSANLQASAEHYSANTDAYHEQAIQEVRDSGVEVNFSDDVATNVRPVK